MIKFIPVSLLEKLKIEYCRFNPNPNSDDIDHHDCLVRTLMIAFPDIFKTWREAFEYILEKARRYHMMPDSETIAYKVLNSLLSVESNIYNNLTNEDTVVIDVIYDTRLHMKKCIIMTESHVFVMDHKIIYDMYEKRKFENILLDTVKSVWVVD